MREVSTTLKSQTALQAPKNRFYRTVWRWHFYAGLFVIPFMLMLGTTGIIYLFKPQLDAAMYHNLMFVQPGATLLPYTEQVQAVQQAYPDAALTELTPNMAADRSTEVALTTTDEQNLTVFVSPYTGQVLGEQDADNNLQANARRLHSELMIGTWGDYLVELAACWALVLLLSGIYLWLPRRNLSIFGTLIPRLWSQNKRIFWRDLHAVPGFYGVLLVGFLILTGLPWSAFWGDTFAQVWGRFPAQMWDDVPASTVLTGSLNQHGHLMVPWAAEQFPMPQSNPDGRSNPDGYVHTKYSQADTFQADTFQADTFQADTFQADPLQAKLVANQSVLANRTSVDVNAVVALAQAEGAPPGFSVAFPEGEMGVYTVSAFPNDPTQEVTMHIDQYSGQLLADVRWQDYGLVPKAVEMGVAIHMGKYFGLANQLLMLLASLIAILLSATGAVLWWQRRPKASGLLGAPDLPAHVPQWRVPLAIVAVLGLVFPLVGLSLVTVLLFDYVVLSRVPLLRRVFY